jgi:hypothetical protein
MLLVLRSMLYALKPPTRPHTHTFWMRGHGLAGDLGIKLVRAWPAEGQGSQDPGDRLTVCVVLRQAPFHPSSSSARKHFGDSRTG